MDRTTEQVTVRVCLDCPRLIPSGSRCAQCARLRDRARGTRQERGYDAAHDRLRANYQQRMDRGERFACWRCNKPINPQAWVLGHDDFDRSIHRGPECPACNYATSGRRHIPPGA